VRGYLSCDRFAVERGEKRSIIAARIKKNCGG
jgi:hypothetical protein